MPEMTPRAFSFNSPHGACTTCQGLGATFDFEPRLVVPDETKSLLDGAIAPWAKGDRKLVKDAILALAKSSGLDPHVPFAKLSKKHRDLVLLGIGTPRATTRSAARSRASSRTCADATRTGRGRSRRTSSPSACCASARPATASGCGRKAWRCV
jgi:excinuclease ABC subunit A